MVFIHGTSSADFTDGYAGKIPSFADLSGEHDKNRDGRFAPDEIPDPLAKRWTRLMDLDADGYLGQDEWAYYVSRVSQVGSSHERQARTGERHSRVPGA